MDEKDKKEFWSIMKAMCLNAGMENLEDPALSRIYFMALQEYSIDQVQVAVVKAMRIWKSSKMIPIGVIVEQIEDAGGKVEDRAIVMATRILDHVHRFGGTKHPDLSDDPIAEKLMRTRWPYLNWASNLIQDEEKWWAKEFAEAYRAETNVCEKPAIGGPAEFKRLAASICKTIPA